MRSKKYFPWREFAPDWRTVVSGILIVLAFPPWNLWPLFWVCLIPWFLTLEESKEPKKAIIQGMWLCYFMTMGCFFWVAFVLQEFGNLPWILAFLGLQIFGFACQPQFYVFAWVSKKLKLFEAISYEIKHSHHPLQTRSHLQHAKKAALFVLLGCGFYTGVDWIIPKLFMDTLGHGLYLAVNLRQAADLGGASLLTFIIVLMNFGLWSAYRRWKQTHSFSFTSPLIIAVLGVTSIWTYGHFRVNQVHRWLDDKKEGHVRGAAIQANIGDFDKLAAERGVRGAAERVIDIFSEMSRNAIRIEPRPDFIIWPETSYPSTFRSPHSSTEMWLDQRIEHFAQFLQVPLLFGGYDHRKNKDYNAFFFLDPSGTLQTYHKSILLLFGEYIPGAETFDFLKEAFPQVGNFGRGKGPSVYDIGLTSNAGIPSIRVGPVICYEVLFPNYVIESARQGSQLILNITNDSWFGSWGEPHLHLALSVFRSIENRLPMIRSTNTGISALVLPDGEITNATRINEKTIMNVAVPTYVPIPTLMKYFGDWFGLFILSISLIGILVFKLRKAA